MAEIKNIPIGLLEPNEGQMYGLPRNPRWISNKRFEDLKKSIVDAPEMLYLREHIVYPMKDIEGHEDHYIILCGNMRFRACVELGYKEVPCKILPLETPVKKLREYATKDNVAYGQTDWDIIANQWDNVELQEWGMEVDWEAPQTDEDNVNEDDGETKVLTDEQLQKLIDKASDGSIVDYNEDTHYDLTQLYRSTGNSLKEKLEGAIASKKIRPEIAELCRVRLAQCSIINFDQCIKYYRSEDSTEEEKELLKKLYLVFITPREAVESGMLSIIAETGQIFEQEFSGE